MAAAGFSGITSFGKLGFSSHQRNYTVESSPGVTITLIGTQNLNLIVPIRCKTKDFRIFQSVQQDRFVTSVDEDEMSDVFFETIEELERMAREPSDVLEEMNERLSAKELQLVLVYFSQEGRDSWCALEVFEWLKKENKVDKETMELMVSIMCGWVKKLIESERLVGEVVDLLVDMDCVGLKPSFSMIEKVISVYWEMGKKDQAAVFVEEVLRREIPCLEDDGSRGGPVGYLAWKMMEEGNYGGAVKLVIHLKESGLKPEVYSYLIAMTAVVKEFNEFAKALRKLKTFVRSGLISNLNPENTHLIENYQSNLLAQGIELSRWAIQEGNTSIYGLIHEKLLAMYVCAGRGVEAELQLWEMKLKGRVVDRYFYDIVLAICASQKENKAISRLLTTLESTSSTCKKKTLSWLLRGYVKGESYVSAADVLTRMLDLGLKPDYLDRVAVLQGLRRKLHESENLKFYLSLCKRLSDADLVGPCLVYVYVKKYKLWVVKML